MSSQLNVDTIVDKAGSGGSNVKMANTSTYVSDGGGATQNTVQGLAKCWVFATNAASLTDSFNIASGTENGTGDYTYAITNDMGNDDYAIGGSCCEDEKRNQYNSARATDTFRVKHYNEDAGGNARDVVNCSQVFGDLA